MTQPKTDLAYLRSEKAKAEQQLRYYKYREKILEHQIPAVSYTHLDVYKRQALVLSPFPERPEEAASFRSGL